MPAIDSPVPCWLHRAQEPSLFEELVYRAYAQDIIGESKAAELLGTSSGEFYRRRTMTEE